MSLTQGGVRHLHPVQQEQYLYREMVLHRELSFPQNTWSAWKTCGTTCSATSRNTVITRAQTKSTQPSCTCFMRGCSFLARRISHLVPGTCHHGWRRLPRCRHSGESDRGSHHGRDR